MNTRTMLAAVTAMVMGWTLPLATVAAACGSDEAIKSGIVKTIAAADERVEAAQARLKDAVSVTDYVALVMKVNDTNVWTAAIQKAIDGHEVVRIPAAAEPYWIDDSLVLKSNRRIEATGAEIRLLAPSDRCMVVNGHASDGSERPVSVAERAARDENIAIIGGRWVDWQQRRGAMWRNNRFESASGLWKHRGIHAMIHLSNVKGVELKGVTIVSASTFAIQLGGIEDAKITDLRFENCHSDGLHFGGNLRNIHVRRLEGDTKDDFFAMNLYDWELSSNDYGPAENVLVEDIEVAKGCPWFRLMPGVFVYPDGSKEDCCAKNILVRRVKGIREFKLYLHTMFYRIGGRPGSGEVGHGDNIFFEDIDISGAPDPTGTTAAAKAHLANFELGANFGHVGLKNITAHYPADASNIHLVKVGPKSAVMMKDYEVFDPWLECKVDEISLSGIRYPGGTPKTEVYCEKFDDLHRDGHSSGRGELGNLNLRYPGTHRAGTGSIVLQGN